MSLNKALEILKATGKEGSNLFKLATKANKLKQEKTVTFLRIDNGVFNALKGGLKTTYTILNGCLGMSGAGKNIYIIRNGDKIIKSGLTLQKAKKNVTYFLK